MSDARIRELERRWRETGAPEDEGAYLKELVRTGGLSDSEVRLAAALGHPASKIVLGDTREVPASASLWRSLGARGPEVAIRVVVALARSLELSARDSERLSMAEAWCCRPGRVSWSDLERHVLPYRSNVAIETHLVNEAIRALGSLPGAGPPQELLRQPQSTFLPIGDWGGWLDRIGEVANAGWGDRWLSIISAELLPWALRRGDPVLRRVNGVSGDSSEA